MHQHSDLESLAGALSVLEPVFGSFHLFSLSNTCVMELLQYSVQFVISWTVYEKACNPVKPWWVYYDPITDNIIDVTRQCTSVLVPGAVECSTLKRLSTCMRFSHAVQVSRCRPEYEHTNTCADLGHCNSHVWHTHKYKFKIKCLLLIKFNGSAVCHWQTEGC